jgi:hypothetical protein
MWATTHREVAKRRPNQQRMESARNSKDCESQAHLEIDRQLVLGRLLYWKITRLRAFENSSTNTAEQPVGFIAYGPRRASMRI